MAQTSLPPALSRRALCRLGAAATLAPLLARPAAALGGAWGEVRADNVVPSTILGQPVHYALYLPPGYQAESRSYPVVYLLHGGGDGAPTDWFELAGADGIFDRLIAAGDMPPFIAVAPDGRRDAANLLATYFLNDAEGSFRWEDMFIREFIPAIEGRYRALGTGRTRGLLGISMGGYAAIAYQFRYPELFAGISALSPAFRTEAQILALDQKGYDSRYGMAWGMGLEGRARLNAQYEKADMVRSLEALDVTPFKRQPRLYLDIGADDPFFAGTAAVHVAMKAKGVQHRFMVREGGHDWPYWTAGLPGATQHLGRMFRRGYGE